MSKRVKNRWDLECVTRFAPLVFVEWLDSALRSSDWHFFSDLPESGPLCCQSVGWLVDDGDDTKILIANVANIGTKNEQGSGIIEIPTRAITKITRLKG